MLAIKNQEQTGFEVAVIGMAGRFPGSKNTHEFWSNLTRGAESITFFSDEELEKAGVRKELINNPNYVKAMAIIDQVEYFDAAFFGYSPNDARALDPQIRIFSECVWEALEDAGYNPYVYKGLIGLYAGASSNYYWEALSLSMNTGNLSEQFNQASLIEKDYLTTRISHNLNLKGPSISIYTACSTSLVAVHMACRGLLTGECNIALAGGVALSLPHQGGYLYQEGMILSPDGHCRAFDAQAKGTVGGEGAGVVALKMLRKAIADHDHIYAVIKGTAINNDGFRKVGYTAPSIEGQADVIQTAQLISRVEPESVSYIEAHGTGTILGDPIELEALKMAFHTGKKQFCYLGSVKTNVGHLDAAAGITGFIKAALALEHKQIPPSLHYQTPNPKIDFINSPFMVNDRLIEWKNDSYPLRAGVSSFGIGGTNAHVVLEEAPPDMAAVPIGAIHESPLHESPLHESLRPRQLILLSAKTESAVAQIAANLADYLQQHPGTNIADLSYTLCLGRAQFPYRRMMVCDNSATDALTQLANQVEITMTTDEKPNLIFVLSGQGALYPNMGRELFENEPGFREEFNHCSKILAPLINVELSAALVSKGSDEQLIGNRTLIESVIFSYEYALAKLLMSRGIKPQSIAGQGAGEYIAACLAGVFSLEEALSLMVWRGELGQDNLEGAPFNESVFQRYLMKVSRIKLKPPQIPFISNVTGNWITTGEATSSEYWARQLRNSLKFADGMKKLLEKGRLVMINIGNGESITNLVKQSHPCQTEEHLILDSINPSKTGSDLNQLLTMVGQLWLTGIDIDWEGFYRNERRRRISLPTYPFERQRFWIDSAPLKQHKIPTEVERITKNEITQWFYLPSWKRTLLPAHRPQSTIKNGKPGCLIFLGDHSFSENLCKRFKTRGIDPVIVKQGRNFKELEPNIYTMNPENESDYELLFHEMALKNNFPEMIIHLWNITDDHDSFSKSNACAIEEFLNTGFYSLLYLARAMTKEGNYHKLQITAMSNHTLKVTDDEKIRAEKATILGPCKVIPQEFPGISCRYIDLILPEPASIQEDILLEKLTQELVSTAPEPVIAYRGIQRWTQVFEPIQWSYLNGKEELISHPSSWFKAQGTYLITGGLGRIGLLIARHLAETVNAKIILVGHSSFPARTEWENWLTTHQPNETISLRINKLKEIESLGAEVLVLVSELSSPEQLEEIIRQAEDRFGRINGVIHAAAEVDGITIHDITKADCERFFLPKIHGLLALYQVFRNRELDFCLLMSSLASILGGVGFVAYAAANLFMDALAQIVSISSKTRWVSINWDGWDLDGNYRKSNRSKLELDGLAITPEAGIKAIDHLFELEGMNQVAVSTWSLQTRIDQWIKLESLKQSPGTEILKTPLYNRPNVSNPYVAPRNESEVMLASIYHEVLGFNQVGVHDNFFELGGNSLKALTLIFRIDKEFQVGLSLNQLFRMPTIEELAAFITRKSQTKPAKLQAEQGIVRGEIGLLPIQKHFFNRKFTDKHHWNISIMFYLKDDIDEAALVKAIGKVVEHHDALRIVFQFENATIRQFIRGMNEGELFGLKVMDFTTEADDVEYIKKEVKKIHTSMDLTKGPLLKFGLFKTKNGNHLLMAVHHLVADGVSAQFIMNDLISGYQQALKGQPIQLQSKTDSFMEWSKRIYQYANSPKLLEELEYWKRIHETEVPPFPKDGQAEQNRLLDSKTLETPLLSGEETAALLEAAKRSSRDIQTLLLAGLGYTIGEWTGNKTLPVTLIVHGRESVIDDLNLTRTVGWLSVGYPVLLEMDFDRDVSWQVNHIKETLTKVPNNGVGHDILRHITLPENKPSLEFKLTPEIIFNFIGHSRPKENGDSLAMTVSPISASLELGVTNTINTDREFTFEIVSSISGDRLNVAINYNKYEYHERTITKLIAGYASKLKKITNHYLVKPENKTQLRVEDRACNGNEEISPVRPSVSKPPFIHKTAVAAINPAEYMVKEKRLENIEPFNDVLYKNCLYNALFPIVFYFGRGIFPIIANDLVKYSDQQYQNEVSLGIETISARPISNIGDDLRLKMDSKVYSENIVADLIAALSNERPACIMIDCYYEPLRRDTFQKLHWPHWILVYGFNLTGQTFDIMEHSDLNSLDYRHRLLGFHDLVETYQGCLTNYQKGAAFPTYYDFINEGGGANLWDDRKRYQSVFFHNLKANLLGILQGLESLGRFQEYFQALSQNEVNLKKKAVELIFQFNEVIKAKLTEKYALEKLFGAGFEPLTAMNLIIQHWNLIWSVLDRFQASGQYRLSSLQNASVKLTEIIELEQDYLGKMQCRIEI